MFPFSSLRCTVKLKNNKYFDINLVVEFWIVKVLLFAKLFNLSMYFVREYFFRQQLSFNVRN